MAAMPSGAENWPGWRPRGDGTSLETNVPVNWSETENIAWKVEVPGVGHASPIVWNDRVFVVSCLEAHSSASWCLSIVGPAENSGRRWCWKVRWNRSTS